MANGRWWPEWGRRARLPHRSSVIRGFLAAGSMAVAVIATAWVLMVLRPPWVSEFFTGRVGLGINTPASPVLRVATVDGIEIVRIPLGDELSWEVHWQHSVAGIVVRDRFAWRDGHMLLTDSRTALLDVAGLGHLLGRGELRDDEAGGIWIAAIDEPIAGNAYWMRIGSARAPTIIVYGERAYPLSVDHPNVLARIEVILP